MNVFRVQPVVISISEREFAISSNSTLAKFVLYIALNSNLDTFTNT